MGGAVFGHILQVAGSDDGDSPGRVDLGEVKGGGELHRAGIKAGNLIVGLVGGDVGRGGRFRGDDADVVGGQAALFQPLEVAVIVVADGGDNARRAAELGQGVGDVAGGAAKVFFQPVDGETDVNHVDFVGHDVVGKAAGEVHDAVVGQGAGNEDVHKRRRSLC